MHIESLMYSWFLSLLTIRDFLHSKGSSVWVMLISPSNRLITAFAWSGGCMLGSITAKIVNPLETKSAVSSEIQLHVALAS